MKLNLDEFAASIDQDEVAQKEPFSFKSTLFSNFFLNSQYMYDVVMLIWFSNFCRGKFCCLLLWQFNSLTTKKQTT